MEELKILYKELQERQKHLESRKKTKITEGRIAENLLTIVRVQQLLIPLVVQAKPEKVCKGSWQLGNNCKKCKRCLDTKPS